MGDWCERLLLRFPYIHTIQPVPVQSMYYEWLIHRSPFRSYNVDYAVLFENDFCSYSALRIVVAWRIIIVVKDQRLGRWKSRVVYAPYWFFFSSERRLLTR